MAQASINVRVEPEAKMQFEDFCNQIGMSMSTAINVFIKATLRAKKIPFELVAEPDPFYSEENMEWLKQSAREIEEGKVVTKTIEELEAMVNG
ncbi:MAG: type II toxin-antitoxin system RelB/DinJ family antitoxin [Schwartzia sp.]|nr:type II toxin-antitoxin system RelB/DinJ family antitoxin [Schwartzia sp. (in: firmicutes)]